ncbi:MAG: RNA methyltransferase [Bacteroidota bacterium]
MTIEQQRKYLDDLLESVTDHKKQLFANVIQQRTRYLTVVLEDIYQPQNASAVLRTADCLGIQDVHIIENKNEYVLNPEVTLGSSKWLTIYRYNQNKDNSLAAIKRIKEQGYRIVAAMPHKYNVLLEEMDTNQKSALFFGTELNGLSPTVQEHADLFVKIPMYGFTESYNISVSAAIFLHYLTNKIRKENNNWKLDESELLEIKIKWAESIVIKPKERNIL